MKLLATNSWNFEMLSETLVDVPHGWNFLECRQTYCHKEDAGHMRKEQEKHLLVYGYMVSPAPG